MGVEKQSGDPDSSGKDTHPVDAATLAAQRLLTSHIARLKSTAYKSTNVPEPAEPGDVGGESDFDVDEDSDFDDVDSQSEQYIERDQLNTFPESVPDNSLVRDLQTQNRELNQRLSHFTRQENNRLQTMDASSDFPWSTQAEMAAMALAGLTLPPGNLSPLRVAQAVGTTSTQIRAWQCHPQFRDRIQYLQQTASALLLNEGIASKEGRVNQLRERHALLTEIIHSRQEWAFEHAPADTIIDPALTGGQVIVPGLASGMMIVRKKHIGGEFGERVIEAEIDVTLSKELREIERQLAMELGQFRPTQNTQINVKLYAGIDTSKV